MKRKQKNQHLQAYLLGLLFFVLSFSFVLVPNQARAVSGNYGKLINDTLAASEWNNLINDFVAKSGSRLDGYFSINTATSSTYALDIDGALRATSIEGSYTGFIAAGNIYSGQFGANAGYGNFSFPGNVGIGTTDPTSALHVNGVANFQGGVAINTNPDNNASGFEYGQGYDPLLPYYYNERFRVNSFLETPHVSMGIGVNFLLRTEEFDNASWVKSGIGAFSANTVVAPNGVASAENIPAGADANANLSQTVASTITGDWSGGVWARAQSGTSTLRMRINGNAEVGADKEFELDTKWRFYSLTQNLPSSAVNKTLVIISGTNAISLWGARLNPGASVNAYRAGGSSANTAAAAGVFFNNSTIYGTLSGNASSASYATYSNYGSYAGYTLSNGTVKTGQWEYVGNIYLGYNSTYRYGQSWNVELKLKELMNDTNKPSDDLEDAQIILRGYLQSVANGTAFHAAVPTFSVELNSGKLDLQPEDVVMQVFSSSTSAKYLYLYVRLKNPNSHYSIVPINRYGASYNSAGTISNSYCYFNYVNNSATVSSLPPPAQGAAVSALRGIGGSNWLVQGNNISNRNTGNVGIGTTSPTSLLDVNGLIKMRTALITANEDVINKGYLDSALASTTAQIITEVATSSFWQGSMTGNIYSVNTGNVGIGTTAPLSKLHINGGAGTLATGLAFGDGDSGIFELSDDALRIDSGSLWLYLGSSSFQTNTDFVPGVNGTLDLGSSIRKWKELWTTSITDNGSGNVGIGTTNPTGKLHFKATGLGYGAGGIRFEQSADTSFWDVMPAYDALFFGYNGGTYYKMATNGLYMTDGGTTFTFLARSGNSYFNAGNVGIGTTTPGTRLTVIGSGNYSIDAGNYRVGNVATPVSALDAVNKSYLDSAIGTAQTAFWNINGSNLYASSTSWNVGIGTTNPTSKLMIESATSPEIRISPASDSNIDPTLYLMDTSTSHGFKVWYDNSAGDTYFDNKYNDPTGDMFFRNRVDGTAVNTLSLLGSGNVGIGTTAPVNRLTVYGTGALGDIRTGFSDASSWSIGRDNITTGDFLFVDGTLAASERMRIQHNTGNVGIGTTTPGTRLTVVGSGNYSIDAGNYRVGNVATPVSALDAVNKSYLDSAIGTAQTAFWNINGSNLYASSTSWNVGIGTTNPSGKLDVTANGIALKLTDSGGNAYIESSDTWGQKWKFAGNSANTEMNQVNTAWQFNINQTTGGLTRFRFNNNKTQYGDTVGPILDLNINKTAIFYGNVGIGTTNPTARLYVNGTSIFNDVATFTQPVIVGAPVLSAHAATKNYVDSQVSSSTGAITFWNGALGGNISNLNSGNVGIGTTSPGYSLEVSGKAEGSNQIKAGYAVIGDWWNGYGNYAMFKNASLTGQTDYAFIQDSIGNSYFNAAVGKFVSFGIGATGKMKLSASGGLSLGSTFRNTDPGGNNMIIEGNVGIGTANPNSRLHLYNTAANAEIDIQSLVGAGNHWGTYSNLGDNSYRIWGGSDYLTILRTGNIGIGTTAPGAYRLFVNGNTNIAGDLNVTGSVTANNIVGPVTGNVDARNVMAGDFGSDTGGGIYSFPSSVGVGTTNPVNRLEINDVNKTTLDLYRYNNFSINTTDSISIDKGGSISLGGVYNSAGNKWGFAAIKGAKENVTDGNASGYLSFITTRAGVGSQEWMRITSTGNVGIGTTAPRNRLDVYGGSSINWSQNNGHALLTVGSINSSGSLFINTPSVDATRPAGLGVDGVYSGGPSTVQLTAYGSYSAATAYYGNILFRTSKATNISDRMFISGDTGNVGIGTTDPGVYRLKVSGDMAVTGTLQTQTGSDFAEEFSVTEDLSAGTVVVMSNEGHKSVKAASSAYDRTVVGIVSDNPSIIAGKVDSEKKVVVAMMGVVSVKASNTNGRIRRGDLLTSADLAGYAMKASEFKPGTIIGKALEDLQGASGQIKVLVNLQ